MCTVTYVKKEDKYIFTSNRDENINRPLAIAPKKMECDGYALYFPKDPVGDGTWFCIKSDGTAIILLNGADKKHLSNPPYDRSRGIVVLELISKSDLIVEWDKLDLKNIEPFTLVAFSAMQLIQFRWNGVQKMKEKLDVDKPHIWSSTTLYSEEIIAHREKWFSDFLIEKQYCPNENELLDFHTQTQKEDVQNGLIINRNHQLLTKNITQCILEKDKFTLTHLDLIMEEKTILIDEIVVA